MNKIIIITGPTATGKTDLAIEMCREFNGEIISADSRQVYRGMDIGTGKDNIKYQKSKIKGWLMDVVEPDYQYNVTEWVREARKVIEDIQERGKIPIVVGGTWLYIKNLLEPAETLDIKPNWELRKELAEFNVEQLQKKLQKIDDKKWKKMNESDKKNPRRLVRAVEVGLSSEKQNKSPNSLYDSLIIGLQCDETVLKKKITERVKERIEKGLLKEIKGLLIKGYNFSLPSFSACGYRIFEGYFEKKENLEQAIDKWILQEQQYAKRQMDFMKQEVKIIWLKAMDINLKEKSGIIIKEHLIK